MGSGMIAAGIVNHGSSLRHVGRQLVNRAHDTKRRRNIPALYPLRIAGNHARLPHRNPMTPAIRNHSLAKERTGNAALAMLGVDIEPLDAEGCRWLAYRSGP